MTDPTNHAPPVDPMSDGEPVGATGRGDSLLGAPALPQRVPPYGHTVDPLEHATPYARGGLVTGGSSWAEPDPDGCEYIVPRRPLSPGLQALREANDRIVEREQILSRLDVDPWRIPLSGLLEYDKVHDEWRVELYRERRNSDAGTVIVRRYAGRRATAALDEPTHGRFISMNRYLVGGDKPGAPRVLFRGDTPKHAAYLARWRRVADAFRKARRPEYDRGRHLRQWPLRVEEPAFPRRALAVEQIVLSGQVSAAARTAQIEVPHE